MDALHRILALVLKEFLAIVKDPRTRFVLIGPPLLQSFLFGYAATYELNDVPYAVLDEDHSGLSRDLRAAFDGSRRFRLAADLEDVRQIASVIDSREALLVLHIGPDFARRWHAGIGPEVQVIIDGRNSNTASVALGYMRSVLETFDEKTGAPGDAPEPTRLVARAWFNPNLESRWFILPALVATLALLSTLQLTAMSVAREREQGTFDQLLVTPYRPVEILIGKSIPGLAFGIVQGLFVVLVAVAWFGVPLRGSLLALIAGVATFALAAVGVGLMISSLSATMQQALLGIFLFMMPAVLLSGFATPIASMPGWIQRLTLANPLRYVMVITRSVFLEGASIPELLPQIWPMGLIAFVTLSFAGWLFRHRMY